MPVLLQHGSDDDGQLFFLLVFSVAVSVVLAVGGWVVGW
jgi:hypothetical protein